MKEKLILSIINLLKVKSIITLLTFVAFFYLSISEKIGSDNFMLIIGMIATYFFNKDNSEKLKNKSMEVVKVLFIMEQIMGQIMLNYHNMLLKMELY